MVLRTLGPFLSHPAVAAVALVLPAEAVASPPVWLAPLVGERLLLVAGGAERLDSVERGLDRLGDRFPIVLVHDGARPFVHPEVIEAVVAVARTGASAVAALPVTDTLKRARPGSPPLEIEGTVSRVGLWRAQTPQGFPLSVLRAGIARARSLGVTPTDDAALVEGSGTPVSLIPDRSTNVKITGPDDFRLAECIALMATP